MAVGDLATLADVLTWLGMPSATSNPQLSRLITAASSRIKGKINRYSLLPSNVVETRDGSGTSSLVLKNWPVNSVSSVSIDGQIIPAGTLTANGGQQAGWFLTPYDGNPPGNAQAIELVGYRFCRGKQNVQISYNCGYSQTDSGVTVSTTYSVAAPNGPWASDGGVVYSATNVAFTKVSANPAVGQYAVIQGVYTFNPLDVGALVNISYGFTPADLYQACIEWVGYMNVQAGRIGLRSKGLGGQETMTFDISGVPQGVLDAIMPYEMVLPIL